MRSLEGTPYLIGKTLRNDDRVVCEGFHRVTGEVVLIEELRREELDWYVGGVQPVVPHPSVLPVLAHGPSFVVTPRVPAEGLDVLLDREGRLSVRRTLAILRQIAAALDAFHAHGLVHRGVKLESILVATDGSERAWLDQSLGACGPNYRCLSPEQVQGHRYGPASDVFSLGLVGYHMLAGVEAFRRDSFMQTLIAHLMEEAPPLGEVPDGVARAVQAALAKAPAARPTALGFLAALEEGAGADGQAALLARERAHRPQLPGVTFGDLFAFAGGQVIPLLGEGEVTVGETPVRRVAPVAARPRALLSAKPVYRLGEVVVLAAAAPGLAGPSEILLGDERHPVTLDGGLGLLRLRDLPAGDHLARFAGAQARFTIASYSLSLMGASAVAIRRDGPRIDAELAVRRFGAPLDGTVRVDAIGPGERVLASVEAAALAGSVKLGLVAPDAIALRVVDLQDPSRLASVPLAAPAADRPRTGELAAGDPATVTVEDAVLIVIARAAGCVTVVDLSTGTTMHEPIAAGETLRLPAPRLHGLVAVGLVVEGAPWEGWRAVLRPATFSLAVSAPAEVAPGATLTVRVTAVRRAARSSPRARSPARRTLAGRRAGPRRRRHAHATHERRVQRSRAGRAGAAGDRGVPRVLPPAQRHR
jgi:hypothetical protein